MHEREPQKETIGKGELFFLQHPGTEEIFSGYGLTTQVGSAEILVGLLMVDRPHPADPQWLAEVETTFGECCLVPMTPARERGIVCQMQIEPGSLPYLRRFPGEKAAAIQQALEPLLENLPGPVFTLRWDEEERVWHSRFAHFAELPVELREVFESGGYGCLPAETNVGVVHVCHAPDADIEGFASKPVVCQWQLIEMPTAPLIRLRLAILDQPMTTYEFESFFDVAHQDLSQLTPRMLGALSNVQTKVIFGLGRHDAEYFTKLIGRVDAEAVKRDPKTENQHELFSPLSEQWEQWVDRLRFQPTRQATVASQDGRVVSLRTMNIPPYTATAAQVEEIRWESLARYGIPYAEAQRNVQETLAADSQEPSLDSIVPPFEVVAV